MNYLVYSARSWSKFNSEVMVTWTKGESIKMMGCMFPCLVWENTKS